MALPPPFEIWASPEPTYARISSYGFRDQLAETGHEARPGDTALLGSLGVAGTRFPILWEKTAPNDPAQPDLRWARARLEALQPFGIKPVVTLLHHGSGPAWTSLVDPAFPEAFATYAGAIARAFPHVMRWTPVNEPLTTARFSTLYGHWYPNAADDASFARAIVNEVRAMVLGMEAIRAVIPRARFVITEDLQSFGSLERGDVYAARASDPDLDDYLDHKRERSFLSIELAMGRIVPGHRMHGYLVRAGIAASELRELRARAVAPDLIGWNYYPNSERVLEREPGGGIANHSRVARFPGSISPLPMLRAAHARLGLPFGLSEVHVDAPQEQRVRWLAQRARDLQMLYDQKLPVTMLGAWAAFGMVDWRSLLREREGYTEDGIFTFGSALDVPRETQVATAVRALARGQRLPIGASPGWWETAGVPPERAASR